MFDKAFENDRDRRARKRRQLLKRVAFTAVFGAFLGVGFAGWWIATVAGFLAVIIVAALHSDD
jgi:fatty acid desaturase